MIEEKIEILKSWMQSGQVNTDNGRSIDDVLTLLNQIKIEAKQPPVSVMPSEEAINALKECREVLAWLWENCERGGIHHTDFFNRPANALWAADKILSLSKEAPNSPL